MSLKVLSKQPPKLHGLLLSVVVFLSWVDTKNFYKSIRPLPGCFRRHMQPLFPRISGREDFTTSTVKFFSTISQENTYNQGPVSPAGNLATTLTCFASRCSSYPPSSAMLSPKMQRAVRVNDSQLVTLSERAHFDHSLSGYLHKKTADNAKWQLRWFVLYQVSACCIASSNFSYPSSLKFIDLSTHLLSPTLLPFLTSCAQNNLLVLAAHCSLVLLPSSTSW